MNLPRPVMFYRDAIAQRDSLADQSDLPVQEKQQPGQNYFVEVACTSARKTKTVMSFVVRAVDEAGASEQALLRAEKRMIGRGTSLAESHILKIGRV